MSSFYCPTPDLFATDAFILTPFTSIPSKCTEQTVASHERYTDLEERALANYFNEVEYIQQPNFAYSPDLNPTHMFCNPRYYIGQAAAQLRNQNAQNPGGIAGANGSPHAVGGNHSVSHNSGNGHGSSANGPAFYPGTSSSGAYRPLGFNRAEEESESEADDDDESEEESEEDGEVDEEREEDEDEEQAIDEDGVIVDEDDGDDHLMRSAMGYVGAQEGDPEDELQVRDHELDEEDIDD